MSVMVTVSDSVIVKIASRTGFLVLRRLKLSKEIIATSFGYPTGTF